MDYEARIDSKMKQIAKTVDKLDETLDKYQGAEDGHLQCYYEQRKAFYEIRKILRKSDDIHELRYEQTEDALMEANEAAGTTEYQPNYVVGRDEMSLTPEDRAIDRIETTLMHLDDTLEGLDDRGDRIRSHDAQKNALHEIKQVLRGQGYYTLADNSPTPGATDGLL